jgi:pSer/pThr/pTyr-binding forkhead associated (FHA) protein
VDLTSKSVYRIGRSPQSDVQLLHLTSSRRHALLFHHSNGSCYVVDCGSAHGTYVNGVRINSPPESGLVVPHRVRRGSMIRFGGPGAPVYMLKSFAFDLEEMKGYSASSTPTTSPSHPSLGAVVQHNTRLNALGTTAKDSVLLSLSSKRSFDSVESFESAETYGKRQRCSSPFFSQEEPLRLVSPDMCCQPNKRRRVSFSDCPPRIFYPSLVTPDLSCDETDSNENECDESV